MNICVIIDAWYPIWGGGQTHVSEVAQYLASKNCKVDIYTRSLLDYDKRKLVDHNIRYKRNIRIITIGPKASFGNPFARIVWLLLVVVAILKNHHKQQYNIIQGHAFIGAIPTKIVSLILRVPRVFTVHGSYLLDNFPHSLFGVIEKYLLTKIKFDQMVSVSNHFLKHRNINRDIKVIPNGVTVELYDKVKRNLPVNRMTLLWAGRFDKVKGLDLLLNAFAQVTIQFNTCQLLLVGNGAEESYLKSLVEKLDIARSVRFIPMQDQRKLIKFYKKANIFILPSRAEGQPISLLEAWAAHCPVIATDVGDNRYMIKNGKNGYLVAANNIEQLRKTMVRALSNPYLQQMGENGYNYVRKNYSWKKTGARYYEIYKTLYKA